MKPTTFFRLSRWLGTALLVLMTFAHPAHAQQGLPQGTVNALMNDPNYCAYGFNPNCPPPSSGGDLSGGDLWHIAMAFSPSTGHWGISRASYSTRGTSRNEKTIQRTNNEKMAIHRCSSDGEIQDCTLAFSEEMGMVSAVLGVLPNGQYQLFAAGIGDDSLNRLHWALGFNLGFLRRDKRERYQVLLDGCREVAQECRVVVKNWIGQDPIGTLNAKDAYGAVFIDEADNSKVFAAASHATPQQAEASARALCQAGGGQQCSRWYGFANMCTAVAVGQVRGEPVHAGVEGKNKEHVSLLALKQCNDRGAGSCRVLIASCSMECDPSQMGCKLPRPQKS